MLEREIQDYQKVYRFKNYGYTPILRDLHVTNIQQHYS